MKALVGLLGVAAVGGLIYMGSRHAAASTPPADGTLPEFDVTGDSGTAWTVRALGVDGDVALFLVMHDTVPILQYSQTPGHNETRKLSVAMAAQTDPLLMVAKEDFGLVAPSSGSAPVLLDGYTSQVDAPDGSVASKNGIDIIVQPAGTLGDRTTWRVWIHSAALGRWYPVLEYTQMGDDRGTRQIRRVILLSDSVPEGDDIVADLAEYYGLPLGQ
jgi:hypothetical protein